MMTASLLASTLRLETFPFSAGLWSRIARDWLSLLDRVPEASVFLSGSWISAWLDVYGGSIQPEALLWRNDQGECVGACLVSIRRERRGPFVVRRAYLNATGEDQLASEHNQLLCVRDHEDQIHDDLVRHLRQRSADSFILQGFRPESVERIRRSWPERGSFDVSPSSDFYVALDTVRASGKEYLSTLSRNTRDQIKRSVRLYEEQFGPPVVEVAKTPEQAARAFAELRELHTARWRGQGQSGAFAASESNHFHESLIARHLGSTNGSREIGVDLVSIRFGSTAIGVLYNFTYRGNVSFYQSGLRYAEDNRLKPGLVAHALAIQSYLQGGVSEYDFLAGEREPARYKESLSNGQRELLWCELGVPNARMWLVNHLRALRSELRQASL